MDSIDLGSPLFHDSSWDPDFFLLNTDRIPVNGKTSLLSPKTIGWSDFPVIDTVSPDDFMPDHPPLSPNQNINVHIDQPSLKECQHHSHDGKCGSNGVPCSVVLATMRLHDLSGGNASLMDDIGTHNSLQRNGPIAVNPPTVASRNGVIQQNPSKSYDKPDASSDAAASGDANTPKSSQTPDQLPEAPACCPELEKCRVCGDKASGVHFGVWSCEGCKGFFKRADKNAQSCKWQCESGNLQCLINPLTRNDCPRCRLNKCRAVGMSKDKIKLGRRLKTLGGRTSKRKVASNSSAVANAGARTPSTAAAKKTKCKKEESSGWNGVIVASCYSQEEPALSALVPSINRNCINIPSYADSHQLRNDLMVACESCIELMTLVDSLDFLGSQLNHKLTFNFNFFNEILLGGESKRHLMETMISTDQQIRQELQHSRPRVIPSFEEEFMRMDVICFLHDAVLVYLQKMFARVQARLSENNTNITKHQLMQQRMLVQGILLAATFMCSAGQRPIENRTSLQADSRLANFFGRFVACLYDMADNFNQRFLPRDVLRVVMYEVIRELTSDHHSNSSFMIADIPTDGVAHIRGIMKYLSDMQSQQLMHVKQMALPTPGEIDKALEAVTRGVAQNLNICNDVSGPVMTSDTNPRLYEAPIMPSSEATWPCGMQTCQVSPSGLSTGSNGSINNRCYPLSSPTDMDQYAPVDPWAYRCPTYANTSPPVGGYNTSPGAYLPLHPSVTYANSPEWRDTSSEYSLYNLSSGTQQQHQPLPYPYPSYSQQATESEAVGSTLKTQSTNQLPPSSINFETQFVGQEPAGFAPGSVLPGGVLFQLQNPDIYPSSCIMTSYASPIPNQAYSYPQSSL